MVTRACVALIAVSALLAGCTHRAPPTAAFVGAAATHPRPRTMAAVPPVPPRPGRASVVTGGATPSALLSWRPSRPPPGARFFVEVMAQPPAASRSVFRGYVDGGSVAVALPAGAGNYQWRVYAVSPRSRRYATSDWQAFSVPES